MSGAGIQMSTVYSSSCVTEFFISESYELSIDRYLSFHHVTISLFPPVEHGVTSASRSWRVAGDVWSRILRGSTTSNFSLP